jgi:hypothetical protein
MPDRACTGSAQSFPSDPAAARPGLAWLLVLAMLTLFGWLAADASVRVFGGWNLALFLFVFPLPYLGALLLLMVAGALGAWPLPTTNLRNRRRNRRRAPRVHRLRPSQRAGRDANLERITSRSGGLDGVFKRLCGFAAGQPIAGKSGRDLEPSPLLAG